MHIQYINIYIYILHIFLYLCLLLSWEWCDYVIILNQSNYVDADLSSEKVVFTFTMRKLVTELKTSL